MSAARFERIARLQEKIERLERLLQSGNGDVSSVATRIGRVESILGTTVASNPATANLVTELREVRSAPAWNDLGRAALVASPSAQRAVLGASLPLLREMAPRLESIASRADTINTPSMQRELWRVLFVGVVYTEPVRRSVRHCLAMSVSIAQSPRLVPFLQVPPA